jgi:hypothetical protein
MKSRSSKLGELKKLPPEMRKYIFSFFNQKDLCDLSGVNKTYNQLRDEEIEERKQKFKNNIFYTVGMPIHISNPKRGMFEFDLAMKHRNEIPNKEIHESFLGRNIDELKLFKTEEEALEYARFLRKGDQLLEGTEVYQPAIFKVIFLHPMNGIEWQKDKLYINKGSWSSCYDMTERESTVGYFETNRVNVIPLMGALKIHCGDKGQFIMHGPIDYDNLDLDLTEENTSVRRCIVS